MIEIGNSIVGVITEIEIIEETWTIEIDVPLEMIKGTREEVQVNEDKSLHNIKVEQI